MMGPIFDSHAHYDSTQFDRDRDELLSSLPSYGISYVMIPGCSVESSRDAIALAEKYDYIYASVGVHPHDTEVFTEYDLAALREMAYHPKVCAISEIGLDYHYDLEFKDAQKAAFRAQLSLARELEKKVIIHEREAWADTIEILEEYPDVTGVFHCYSGSAEGVKYLIPRGWLISFTGVITFKNARKPLEALAEVPLDRLMIETDAPYLTPVPNRSKRNDSRRIIDTATRMAEIKGVTVDEILQITHNNAKRFYGIE